MSKILTPAPAPIPTPDLDAPKLTASQARAFKEYSEAIGFDINQSLREGTELSHEKASVAKEISTAFKQHGTLDKPIQTYRALSWSHKEDFNAFLEQMKNGRTIQMKGFISTSLDKRFVEENFTGSPGGSVVLDIKATRGIRMKGALTQHEEQMELLMDHNSRFKVLGTSQVGSMTYVELEQLK